VDTVHARVVSQYLRSDESKKIHIALSVVVCGRTDEIRAQLSYQ
jgi:hypothetical protein